MKIYEIIKNLINNAIKYTIEGNILCEIITSDINLKINIYDTGIGIPKSELDYIFESFNQINYKVNGVGLGLSITKKLVSILGGTIDVNSRVGVGSTFMIDIPIKKPEYKDSEFPKEIESLLNKSNKHISPIILKALLRFPKRIEDLNIFIEDENYEELMSLLHKMKGVYSNLSLKNISSEIDFLNNHLQLKEEDFSQAKEVSARLKELYSSISYQEYFNRYLMIKGKKLEILIAEDIEENQEYLKTILSSDNIEVTCVNNGLETMEILTSKKFDLLFLDIQMPVMDGIDTIKEIRSTSDLKELEVVALTAQAIKGDRNKLLPLGFDGYLTKPIDDCLIFSYLENVI